MSSLHNFINIRNLTLEQQRVYVMYVNQYDLISNQIDTLHEMLYDIRANISDLQTNNVANINSPSFSCSCVIHSIYIIYGVLSLYYFL